jgi:hypothetical protein
VISEADHDRMIELAQAGTRLTAADARLLRDIARKIDRMVQRDFTGRRINIKLDEHPELVFEAMDDRQTWRTDLRPHVYDWMATQLKSKPATVRILNGMRYITLWFKTKEDAALFKVFWL